MRRYGPQCAGAHVPADPVRIRRAGLDSWRTRYAAGECDTPARCRRTCRVCRAVSTNRVFVGSMANGHARRASAVGITFTTARLSNPRRPDVAAIEIELLVDSGA